ncbi:MBL fold metallo-hydrolase [Paracoccus rhizosphaerae]|uniref:MBL fold metallo-hydrolase n=1 Tax=Paracoccus rhizosphaerae TaxID=1133347 RepID=A0ABV6CK74_9RHOB|nr:MBL fold metallo-hydrolase [Paracoccus rhizosphaerae]
MPELVAISGVGVKGPACFLLRMQGRNLLLDLGRGPDGATLPDLQGLPPIDAILFSHGHADHTGGLELWEDLGKPPLFATSPTIALARQPALQQAIALETLDKICGLPLETGPAGHAPGAVWMRIGGPQGLLYTGDISAESVLFRYRQPPAAQALILDSAYGALGEALGRQMQTILALADGPVLFPCPAGGRGLEIAWTFLRHGLPVSICSSHRQVATRLRDFTDWLNAGSAEALDHLLQHTGQLDEDSRLRGIMVAASPNLDGGTARPLAQRIVQDGGARIVLTGHVGRGSQAEDLLAAGKAEFHRWNVHPSFSGASDIVTACAPRTMIAAFCDPGTLDRLRTASGWPIAKGERLTW